MTDVRTPKKLVTKVFSKFNKLVSSQVFFLNLVNNFYFNSFVNSITIKNQVKTSVLSEKYCVLLIKF